VCVYVCVCACVCVWMCVHVCACVCVCVSVSVCGRCCESLAGSLGHCCSSVARLPLRCCQIRDGGAEREDTGRWLRKKQQQGETWINQGEVAVHEISCRALMSCNKHHCALWMREHGCVDAEQSMPVLRRAHW
jgi:hypothetical protein